MATNPGKALSLLIVLFVITVIGGCTEKPATPGWVVANALEAQADARTYRMDMDMRIDIKGITEGVTIEGNMSTEANTVIDLPNREVAMTWHTATEGMGEPATSTDTEMYLFEDITYLMRDVPGEEPMWMKQEIPEGAWEQETIESLWQSQFTVEQQLQLLEAADVKLLEEEKVDGVDCYRIEMTPDINQLLSILFQQPGMAGMPTLPFNMGELVSDVSVRQWFAKETFFLRKAEIHMVMSITPEAMGAPEGEGGVTVEMDIDMSAYDHNEPVSIELPEEAKNATEMPSWE